MMLIHNIISEQNKVDCMCGIAGFSGRYERELLARMSDKIAHRGPDDSGIFYDEKVKVGLLHRRLSILDLSASGHQPMWDSTNQVCIVFNGEIFNFRELRSSLLCDGFVFKSESDTEVLIYLYLKYGKDMLYKINGMFAFSIWDVKRKELFIARDGVGIKPLYYSVTNNGFVFSSELKALMVVEDIDKSIDADAVNSYLTYLWSPAPMTMLKNIKKLPPGCAMVVKNGKVAREWQYYELPYDNKICQYSTEEAIETVREKVELAIERQMISDVPVGCFLSGGLDSSSIAAISKIKNNDQALQCFTINVSGKGMNEEGMTDDLPYARKVAKHLNAELEVINVDSGIINSLSKMIYHLDEPQADPAPLNAMLICERAKEMGYKVLLSGAGGDDIFTGYRRHYALSQEAYWSWLPSMVRKGLSLSTSHLSSKKPITRRIRKAFKYAHYPKDRRIASYFDWIGQDVIKKLKGPLLLDSVEYDTYSPLLKSLTSVDKAGLMPDINKMLFLDSKYFLADHNLNYTDKVSMASGVEVRVPLLDMDLIDYVTTLPIKYKQNGRIGKWIFKKSMERYLPNEIIYRPKTGFGAPLRYWLKNELKPLRDEYLSGSSLLNRGLFDPKAVNNLLALDEAGKIDASYTIFSIMCMEIWFRVVLEGKSI